MDRKKLVEKAHKGALEVFKANFEPLLLTQPVPNCAILGIDPGFAHGMSLPVPLRLLESQRVEIYSQVTNFI